MLEVNKEKLKNILVEVFNLEDNANINSLEDFKRIEDNLHWDSLAVLSLIAALESEYKIVLEVSDYEKIDSLHSINNILEKHQI